MNCEKCGASLRDGAHFCGICGEPAPRRLAEFPQDLDLEMEVQPDPLPSPGSEEELISGLPPDLPQDPSGGIEKDVTATGVYFREMSQDEIVVEGESPGGVTGVPPGEGESPGGVTGVPAEENAGGLSNPNPVMRGSELKRSYIQSKEAEANRADAGRQRTVQPPQPQDPQQPQPQTRQIPPQPQVQAQQTPPQPQAPLRPALRKRPTQRPAQQGPVQTEPAYPSGQDQASPPPLPPQRPTMPNQSLQQPPHYRQLQQRGQAMQPQRPYQRTTQQSVQSYYSTQLTQPAFAPSGTAYTRQDIQRMLEEDKRKKKILLIGLPGLAVVVGAIVALLFLFVFAGGLSPEEYREQAAEIHGQVAKSFILMDSTWTAADVDLDLAYSEGYNALKEEAGTALSEVKAAQVQLNEIKPPDELEALHNDLITFYADAESYLVRADPVFKFVSELMAILEDWGDRPWAVERLTDNSTPAEVIALMDEDLATLDAYIAQFEGLGTPPECENMRAETINCFVEGKGIIERIK